MRAIVQTLIMAAGGLRDAAVLCVFIFFMFGIIGDTLFGGVLRRKCFTIHNNSRLVAGGVRETYTEDPAIERMCGGEYTCPETHACMFSNSSPNFSITSFDHIGAGFLTIFVAITLEGWVDVMYQVQDGYSYLGGTVYFHSLIIVGSLFAVNLALAVISDCFDQTVDTDGEAIEEFDIDDLDDEALQKRIEEEIDNQMASAGGGSGNTSLAMSSMTIVRKQKRMARKAASEASAKGRDEKVAGKMASAFRIYCSAIESSPWFTNIIMLTIIANTVTLAREESPTVTISFNGTDGVLYTQERAAEMDRGVKHALEVLNIGFVAVFSIELVIKMVALGTAGYWEDTYNKFDLFVVLMSYIELIGAGIGGSYTALRAFRLMRIFKIARRWKAMQTILVCILETLPSMGYLCILLLLFMFMMAVAGMFLFGAKMSPPLFDELPRAHFDNFGVAMLTVFQVQS